MDVKNPGLLIGDESSEGRNQTVGRMACSQYRLQGAGQRRELNGSGGDAGDETGGVCPSVSQQSKTALRDRLKSFHPSPC
jgi:hypothetical protein